MLEYRFRPKQWYHVVLCHSAGTALSSSYVTLFVNGTLEATAKLRYPKVCIMLHTLLCVAGVLVSFPCWLQLSAIGVQHLSCCSVMASANCVGSGCGGCRWRRGAMR